MVYNFVIVSLPNSNSVNLFTESLDSNDLVIESFGKMPKQYKFEKSNDSYESMISSIQLNETSYVSTFKDEYIDYVSKIKNELKNQEIIKVLAAQKVVEPKPTNFDVIKVFKNLKKSFPDTLIYILYIEQTLWIGATPELVGKWENNYFETIALAGTASSSEQLTSKEKEEQEIVLNQIIDILNPYTSQSIDTHKRIIPFGDLVHYQNSMGITLNSYESYLEILKKIHPSAALIGYPKEKSLDFVMTHEPIHRNLYTGLLTISTNQNQSYSYGIIRVLEVTKNQFIWYSGAGITAKSDPEYEYIETQNKIKTLQKGMN